MAVSLGQLKRGEKTLQIKVGDEVVRFTYKPGLITPSLGYEMAAHDAPVVKLLMTCLVSWDITETDEAGSPMLPITEASLNDLPSTLLVKMKDAIQEDIAGASKNS